MNETINDVLRKDYDSCVKDLKKSEKKREKIEKENQRLNNILNELEDYIKNSMQLYFGDIYITYKEILDKLNKLKEGDK